MRSKTARRLCRPSSARALPALAGLAFACFGLARFSAAAPSGYEEPPTLKAADLLPAELLEGDHHTVETPVRTDGFMAYFTIRSDYGTYKAASLEEAATRINEVYAIAALDEMSRAAVAGKGVVEGVRKPFLAVKNVATRPAETLGNAGEGIGRWIERGKLSLHKAKGKAEKVYDESRESYDSWRDERRQAKVAEREVRDRALAAGEDPEAAVKEYRQRRKAEEVAGPAAESDAQRKQKRVQWAAAEVEKATYRYLGYDKARRRLAADLGVNPYSTNLELQERLDSMAWALWAGQFGTGYAIPANALLGYVKDVNDLVWTRHPKDLEVRDRKTLKALGVEIETIDAFFANRLYTVADRTQMVADLASLEGVARRDHFFRLAAAADGWRPAAYFRRGARMLARGRPHRSLDRIVVRSENLLAAVSRGGDLVLALPADHLAWTESLALVVGGVERHRREAGFEGGVVLVLGGGLTARARKGVEDHGWTVETWGLERLLE